MERFRTTDVRDLISDYFRFRTLESAAASATSPQAMIRRLHDILHLKTETVTLGVMDEIATTCGHTEWLQILEPV